MGDRQNANPLPALHARGSPLIATQVPPWADCSFESAAHPNPPSSNLKKMCAKSTPAASLRILYIHSTQVPPPVDKFTDRFYLMSEFLEGDVLQPIWFRSREEVEAELGPGSFPVYESGRFRYHWFLAFHPDGRNRSRLARFWFYIRKGVELHRERAFDCIIAYSHMTTGLMAACVKLLTGAKLIIEVVINPKLAYVTEYAQLRLRDRLMKLYSDVCLHLTVWAADRVHLLYPTQLAAYATLRKTKASVFHEYVTVSKIQAHTEDEERYIVLVGSPWHRKGADRLIEAFKLLAPDFPDVKLKIVGWYLQEERQELEALAGDWKQIELVRAVPNPATLRIISGSMVLVHPARCEGGPRTVVEGLAAGVPVVGSDVGFIPELIRQGENGFVVPGGNVPELAQRLRQLLADPDLRRRLGENGYKLAHTELTEEVYVKKFTAMIAAAVRGA
jgi:glycosyltransferase involved in cell wall biosynthesis